MFRRCIADLVRDGLLSHTTQSGQRFMWFWNIGAPRRQEPPSAPLAGMRVLLVEDAFDVHRRNVRELQSAGASVDLECSWQSACELLDRRPEAYDAVAFDFDMPLPDQVETTRRLRERGIDAVFLALTCKTDREVRRQGIPRGCDAVLHKPIDRRELASCLAGDAGEQRRLAKRSRGRSAFPSGFLQDRFGRDWGQQACCRPRASRPSQSDWREAVKNCRKQSCNSLAQ